MKFDAIKTSDYSDPLSTKHRDLTAEKRGLVIKKPTERELFIDIDSNAQLKIFREHLKLVQTIVGCSYTKTRSPSRKPGHWHIVVTTDDTKVMPFDRILLQALLGSDLKREALSWLRLLRGVPDPTVFFERPARGGKAK